MSKINTKKLRRINPRVVRRRVKQTTGRLDRIRTEVNNLRRRGVKKKRVKDLEVELKKFSDPSRLPPSKLPRSILPSRIPISKIPKSKLPSKLRPSRLPSRLPSRIPSSRLFKSGISGLPIGSSLIPLSRLPPSRIPVSRVPPSRLPPSKLPPSRIPRSKLPPSRVPPPGVPPEKFDRIKQKDLTKLTGKVIQQRDFIYIPDLYSIIYGIKSKPLEKRAFLRIGRVFTGVERRKLI